MSSIIGIGIVRGAAFLAVLRRRCRRRGRLENNGCADGPAIVARHRHAVNTGLDNLVVASYGGRHLGCAHVLGFPVNSVAQAVNKVPASSGIAAHEVAGAKVGVTFCSDVADNFAVGVVAQVAMEVVGHVREVEGIDQFAGFIGSGKLAESGGGVTQGGGR